MNLRFMNDLFWCEVNDFCNRLQRVLLLYIAFGTQRLLFITSESTLFPLKGLFLTLIVNLETGHLQFCSLVDFNEVLAIQFLNLLFYSEFFLKLYPVSVLLFQQLPLVSLMHLSQ